MNNPHSPQVGAVVMPPGDTAAIVVAAGSGQRFGGEVPKALVPLHGRPLVQHAVENLQAAGCTAVWVVVPAAHQDQFRQVLAAVVPAERVITGGADRQASVRRGLAALQADPALAQHQIVLVHDAARPLAPPQMINQVIAQVRSGAVAVAPARPMIDSVRQTSGAGSVALNRTQLVTMQTPQGFDRDTLLASHQNAGAGATDDVSVCEQAGHPVTLIPGDPLALKITEPSDLLLAAALSGSLPVTDQPGKESASATSAKSDSASEQAVPARTRGGEAESFPVLRTGIGTDAHRLAAGQPMHLAGLHFPECPVGAVGHSDGDVAAHAICDALLAAAGLGDLGEVVGVDDPNYRDASGAQLLTEVAALLRQARWQVVNVSVQVIGNQPRLSPRRAAAEATLSALLDAPVSVSATTTDGLGCTGRGEGIAAVATVLLTGLQLPRAVSERRLRVR